MDFLEFQAEFLNSGSDTGCLVSLVITKLQFEAKLIYDDRRTTPLAPTTEKAVQTILVNCTSSVQKNFMQLNRASSTDDIG